ncbi:MAG TPA: radical SAM protein [Candidatus Hydrogenedentes bacterium]|nr:radical SAM protein [Candidatus Hydrogenedentota bacterium]HIJ72580.1 radical SAM protein [Candidatus Hydrogenedentota bacterium]
MPANWTPNGDQALAPSYEYADEHPAASGPPRAKICLACSHGGHLTEMHQLAEAFAGHDTFYFCYDAHTTRPLLNAYLVPNMARNPIEFVRNLGRLFRIFRKERPDLVVSTGAEIAIPVGLVAKLFRVPMIYVECGAQVTQPSLTGRLMYWLADGFYVQWPELIHAYGPRALFRGSLIDENRPFKGDRSAESRMNVTLVQPAQSHGFSSDQPPMGLGYVASALEQVGCAVRLIDANVEKLTPKAVANILMQQSPDIVCFTVTTPLVPSALDTVRDLRHRIETPPVFVAGGPHATVLPEELLVEDGFDYVVRGEGEDTVAELAEGLLAAPNETTANIEDIAGVSWRRGSAICHNPDRALCHDVDSLPWPDWSIFPLTKYSSLARRNDFCLPIMTTRGCPYACTFCYKGIYGQKVRLRSPESVVDEWQFLIERYGAKEIAVIDDVFTIKAERAIAVCDLLVARGLDRIPWSTTNGIRVNNVAPKLMHALKRAGCYRVYFGAESGVQRVIDDLNKKISLDQVRDAVRMAREAGLEVGLYFMLGNVGETETDMKATVAFCLELDPDYAQFTIATPYPGTEMYRQIEEGGEFLFDSWEDLASYGNLAFTMGDLTPEGVGRMYRQALRRFYFRPKYVLRQGCQSFTWTGLKHRIKATRLLAKMALPRGRQ